MVRLIFQALQKSLASRKNVARKEFQLIVDLPLVEKHSYGIIARRRVEESRTQPCRRGPRKGVKPSVIIFARSADPSGREIVAGIEHVGKQGERHRLVPG